MPWDCERSADYGRAKVSCSFRSCHAVSDSAGVESRHALSTSRYPRPDSGRCLVEGARAAKPDTGASPRPSRGWTGLAGCFAPGSQADRDDIWHLESAQLDRAAGNTMVLREVAMLLEEGRAVGAKALKDYIEVLGLLRGGPLGQQGSDGVWRSTRKAVTAYERNRSRRNR